jgi:hypothetical protein
VLAGKGGYFAAIAADGHRTPPAAASTRIVVEEEATVRISAKPEARGGTLSDNFRARSSHSGEQPIKASFTRHEFDFPEAVLTDKFIVPFGDAKDFVYGLDPFSGRPLPSEHGCEHFAQAVAEPPGLQEKGFGSLGVGLRQAQKLRTALRGDNVRGVQEVDEAFPG